MDEAVRTLSASVMRDAWIWVTAAMIITQPVQVGVLINPLFSLHLPYSETTNAASHIRLRRDEA